MKIVYTILVFLLILTPLYGWDRNGPVTPYGDYCPRCSNYGVCRLMLSPAQARKALKDYYSKKGLGIKIDRVRGRFIKARILDGSKVVDIIIFDRKTGRIRSIL